MEHKPAPIQTWTTAVTFMFILLAFLAINVLVVARFLMTLMMGGILALLLNPLYQKLRKRKWKPHRAALFLTFVAAITIIAPLVWFALNAVKQGSYLADLIAHNQDGAGLTVSGVSEHVSQLDLIKRMGIGAPEIAGHIQNAAKLAAGVALSIMQTVPEIFLHLAIALLTCMFLLRDGKAFVTWFHDKVPLDPDARKNLFKSFKETAISTIWASLVASSAESLLMFTAFVVIGMPVPFLAGAFSFILSWIPIVGTSPIWGAGAIYLFTQDRVVPAIALIALGLGGGIMNNFIKAIVIRGRNNLHPMVSLVTIIGGIGMFGLLGVFFGPILAAVLLSLLDVWPAVGRRYGLLRHPTRTLETRRVSRETPERRSTLRHH